jgi:hypothetical protein
MIARLDFELSLTDDSLRVSYTVDNLSGRTLHVADGLLVSRGDRFARVTGRLIVMNAAAPGERRPGEIQLALAAISSNRATYTIYPPTFAAIEAGGRHSAEVVVPLPLRAWHNLGGAEPLDGPPRSAVMKIDCFARDVEWARMPSDDAEPILVPVNPLAELVTAGPRPVP